MKILFLYNYGAGNCIEQIPLYLALEKEYGRNIHCAYLIQTQGDNPKNADCTPNPICPAVTLNDIMVSLPEYDYIVKPPWIYTNEGGFLKEHVDQMREMDSEVRRNMRIADYLGIDWTIERKWREKEIRTPDRYVVMHNGCAPGWERKKYNKMEILAWMLQRENITCVSIGAPTEYIFGTENYTGVTWRETAHIINSSIGYLGTDTGSYHLAAMMEKPGTAIFTMTSIGKNWDKELHKTITPIQRTDLACCPCQLQYHYSHEHYKCQNAKCQDIDAEEVFNLFMENIDGT